jgi:hypothetical protein
MENLEKILRQIDKDFITYTSPIKKRVLITTYHLKGRVPKEFLGLP